MSDETPLTMPNGELFYPAATIERLTRERDRYASDAGERAAKLDAAEATIEMARYEASCCDDIALDQSLGGIISDLQSDRERIRAALAKAQQERDEAREFMLEFRGVVTDEMVLRACNAFYRDDAIKWADDVVANMRAALMAANVCESCASVADHWIKQAESLSAQLAKAREALESIGGAQMLAVADWEGFAAALQNIARAALAPAKTEGE